MEITSKSTMSDTPKIENSNQAAKLSRIGRTALLAKVREDLAHIGQMGVDMGLFVDTMSDPSGRYKLAQKEKHEAEERILNLFR